jgi:hypothetical protein
MRVEEPGGGDAVSVNPDRPVYQVNIYRRSDDPDTPDELRGYHVSEWKLRDADVIEVLTWAKEQAGASPYVVSVASALDGGESHLLRLHGQDLWPDSDDTIRAAVDAALSKISPSPHAAANLAAD